MIASCLSILSVLGIFLIFVSMLCWPSEAYHGAARGLELWALVLVPSLLPFFIFAEIILNLGIVKALGVLLEPLMRPLFNLPGSASFVLIIGFTAGFPMGALLTRRLLEERLCSINEAERLVAFTNNSSVLFILAAIATGIFKHPPLGIVLIAAQDLSSFLWGMLLGLSSKRPGVAFSTGTSLLSKSIKILLEAQHKRAPWGELLGQTIKKAIGSITLIGGFVVIFAVIINLLEASSILGLFAAAFNLMTSVLGTTIPLGSVFATGFWEISLGIQELAKYPFSLTQTAVSAGIMLAWGGISIQMQVAGVLAGSGINPRLYYLSRIPQCFLSGAIAWLLTKTSYFWLPSLSVPVFSVPFLKNVSPWEQLENNLLLNGHCFALTLLLLSIFCFFFYSLRCLKNILSQKI